MDTYTDGEFRELPSGENVKPAPPQKTKRPDWIIGFALPIDEWWIYVCLMLVGVLLALFLLFAPEDVIVAIFNALK